MAFIITTWYKRAEVQKRLAVFYLTAILLTGFSSILAYGLQLIGDRGGLKGWRWIFLIEGLLTICLGLLTWFFIPDQVHIPIQPDFHTSHRSREKQNLRFPARLCTS